MTNVYKYVNRTDRSLEVGSIDILPYGEYTANATVPALDKLDGILVDRYVNGVQTQVPVEYNYNRIVISPEPGTGIMLDVDDPKFGWHDLLGNVTGNPNAASYPNFLEAYPGIFAFKFFEDAQVFLEFHIPHDYLPGSDLYIHTHWFTTNPEVTSGDVTWQYVARYAKGYARGSFNDSSAVTYVSDEVTGVHNHHISETKLSSTDPDDELLDTNLIEPDGVVLLRVKLDVNNIADESGVFMVYTDIHYQTTGVPTKNRNYNFYG